jgi:hypothetical protein
MDNEDNLQAKILKEEKRKLTLEKRKVEKICFGQSGDDGNKFRRINNYTIRFSTPEYQKLTQLYLKSGENTIATYIRKSCLKEKIIQKNSSKMSEEQINFILNNLIKIGNNLNQITKRVHTFSTNEREVMKVLNNLSEELTKISKKLD